ncbi:hypothetical protein F5Y15DRAFT_426055 [Xylariaceae sp. FL0016]|nr:hypothetical protein F5Y15DRAFT_426055 [Xylariaceae sp. FL0016]
MARPQNAKEWLDYLMSVDWTKYDYIELEKEDVPWEEFNTHALEIFSNAFTAYNEARGYSTMKRFENPATDALRHRRLEEQNGMLRSAERLGLSMRSSHLTLGVSTEIAIAPMWNKVKTITTQYPARVEPGRIYTNPHIDDDRWAEESLQNEDELSVKFIETTLEKIADVMQQGTGLACHIRTRDENSPENLAKMKLVDEVMRGEADIPDWFPPPVLALMDDTEEAAQAYFRSADSPKNRNQYTEADIEAIIEEAYEQCGLYGLNRYRIPDHFESFLKVRLLAIAWRDKTSILAVGLPKQKLQYKVWSVKHLPHKDRVSVSDQDYIGPPRYSLVDNSHEPLPVDMYRWCFAKVSSPVLRLGDEARIRRGLHDAYAALRARLRIHRDAPALNLTSQVTVGHTGGFALRELKRVVTVFALTRAHLARLHRRHRTRRGGRRYGEPCAPIDRDSRLAATYEAAADGVPGVGEEAVRRALRAEFEADVGTELLMRHVECGKRRQFIRNVWRFGTIDDLVIALAPAHDDFQLDLMVKCQGRNHTTDGEGMLEVTDKIPFHLPDPERGVFQFRQQQSSLCARDVSAWAAVCAKVVASARKTDAEFKVVMTNLLTGNGAVLDVLGVASITQNVFRVNVEHNGYYLPPDSNIITRQLPFYHDITDEHHYAEL